MFVDLNYISPKLRKIKECSVSKRYKCNTELGCLELHDGYVSPYVDWINRVYGGAITANRECVIDLPWMNKACAYTFENAVVEHKRVIYLGVLHSCFGHVITDNLRKLWFLGTSQAKKLFDEGVEVVYTTPSNVLLPLYAYEIFKMAGVDMSQARLIDKLTQFDMIYVPDNCFSALKRMFTPEWAEMIERIKENAIMNSKHTNHFDKQEVFLTRVNWKGGRHEVGEKNLLSVFEKEGFKIVSPEELSISEQINMVHNCDRLVVTEGSVAHLSVFCKPGTNVVILCKANYDNLHQDVINECADLNVTYIEAHNSVMASKDTPWLGPFYLCVTDYLERYIGHPIPHVPCWIRPSY